MLNSNAVCSARSMGKGKKKSSESETSESDDKKHHKRDEDKKKKKKEKKKEEKEKKLSKKEIRGLEAEAAKDRLQRGLTLKKRLIEAWEAVTSDATGRSPIRDYAVLLQVLEEVGFFKEMVQVFGKRRKAL